MRTKSLPRRSALAGATALVASGGLSGGTAHAGAKLGPWAIELFTSQGCSSCPPADLILGDLARRPDIVALSFHVNYWDYIGWKDAFASKTTTERQRSYARALRQRYVYTPEMVVDGFAHNPGTELPPIQKLLAEARARSKVRATPDLSRNASGRLTIKLAAFDLGGGGADVSLAVYDRRHATKIMNGENGGRMLENFNVVRRFDLLDRWDGREKSWTVPGETFAPGQGIAVLVQHPDHGPVLGCNKLDPTVSG